jgi:hypothetical protein
VKIFDFLRCGDGGFGPSSGKLLKTILQAYSDYFPSAERKEKENKVKIGQNLYTLNPEIFQWF